MHGGRSTGPKKKRNGDPATVKKPLEWTEPSASRIMQGDYLYEVNALIRVLKLIERSS